mgnify:CR=1 FL=1
MWVATGCGYGHTGGTAVSIHATRVGGDVSKWVDVILYKWVSIHATRVGGDTWRKVSCALNIVSIHATRVGGDRPQMLI